MKNFTLKNLFLFTIFIFSSITLGFSQVTLALQDFDGGVPAWNYSNDVTYFDNTFGTDGYYGILDSSLAAPLNNVNFGGNILAENDLDDEGNGTTGFANTTFDIVDISAYINVNLSFDYDIIGYDANNDDARYEVFFDGVSQGLVYLLDGDSTSAINDANGSVSINIPDSVNEVYLVVSIRNNGLAGYSGFDNFEITGTALPPNQILITQYYEGAGNDKWYEIKNISGTTIPANLYYIARFNNADADAPSGVTPVGAEIEPIPAMGIDEIIVYKNPSATSPTDPMTGTIITSNVTDVNGDDLIVISTSNNSTCYNNRVDIIGDGSNWGQDVSFVRGCGADTANTTFNLSEWTQFDLAEVDVPVAADANVALGVHNTGATTFNNTFSWDNGTPDQSRPVIIDENYETGTYGSFEACSLLINLGNTLAIQNTDALTIANDITIDGVITVATEGSLVQVNDASTVSLGATGDGVLQKTTTTLTAWYDYTYWSSPVSNETIGSVFGLVPANRIFEYNAANYNDSDNDGFDDEGNDWSIATGVMTPGRGYAAVAENNPFPFPQTNTMVFNGQFNNGIITAPVTISPGPNPLNYNFLGNPYPSPINAISFVNDPANAGILDGTLYFWTHNSPPDEANPGNDGQNFSVDDYATYSVGSGGTAAVSGGATPSEYIATGQGFFIEGLSAGVATFNNSMRTNSNNDNFYRTTDKIWLNFKNNFGAFSQILLGFNEYATDGYDRLYDSKRLGAGSFVSFYTFIDDQKFAIQSRSQLNEDQMVPLGFNTTIEGENEFSISIDRVEGQLDNSEVFLLDFYLNLEHDLNESEYSFTTLNGEFHDRFALRLTSSLNQQTPDDDKLIVSENEIGGLEFLTTNQSEITNIKIYDLLGRQFLNSDFNKETKVVINTSSLKNAVYITKVTLNNGLVLTKKILK